MKLLKTYVFIILSSFFYPKCFGQIAFYEDVFNGGVTGDGYNPWYFEGAGNINLNIDPASTIRKAFLFYSVIRPINLPIIHKESMINLNGTNFVISTENPFSTYISNFGWASERHVYSFVTDVTNAIDPSINTYILTPPAPINPIEEVFFAEYYLLVFYESNVLNKVAVNVYQNDKNGAPALSYQFNSSMPMDISQDIGLAIHASNMCDTIQDGSYVLINSNPIGLIGGQEYNTNIPCAGVTGSFYYENSTLNGLNNDIANQNMAGLDAIAEISSYLLNNNTFNIDFNYQSNFGPNSNTINQFFLTYTTPCDTFSVSSPNDTTLCQGETLQLNATGGQGYEWLPATGLSCTDCPNPIFTADSSMFYTVRIWNNDTCSVVRPLKINVRPRPEFGNLTTTPSECGANTGTVTLNVLPNNGIVTNWQEVGGATQTSNVFQNLSTGNHTFFFVDTNGCQSADTTVFVGEINSTSASFIVSPQSGAVPLSVVFTNTSQNATNFEWFVEGVSVGSSLQNWEFGNSGYPEISLVAWSNDPGCADTSTQSVFVYDSLMIHIPNVFTPNYDGVNDFFEITNSLPVHCELVIVNRWGNVMYEFSDNLGAGSTKLWDGFSLLFHGDMIEGTYFYDVIFSGANEQTQELEKLGILPIKKSGFVEVRR